MPAYKKQRPSTGQYSKQWVGATESILNKHEAWKNWGSREISDDFNSIEFEKINEGRFGIFLKVELKISEFRKGMWVFVY